MDSIGKTSKEEGTSSSHHHRGPDISNNDLGDGKVQFFKLILSSAQRTQLRLPMKFAESHGSSLSNQASLAVPIGGMWEVEVVKSGDEIWLRRGWDKFVEDFAINLGYFLMFRYEGDSRFRVFIFDMYATEIEYPVVLDSMEFPSDFSPKEDEVRAGYARPRRRRVGVRVGEKIFVKEAVIQKAEALRCNNPSFVAIMFRSAVSHKYSLHIPNAHGKKYLTKTKDKFMTFFIDGSDKRWRARYSVGKMGSRGITSGWDAFVWDNHLKLGDVCVFELIPGEENLYKVHIFRNEDN